MAWWFSLLFGILFAVVSYLLTPKPKAPQPPEVENLEGPTAEFREIPIVFGSITVKNLQVLWYGDRSLTQFYIYE